MGGPMRRHGRAENSVFSVRAFSLGVVLVLVSGAAFALDTITPTSVTPGAGPAGGKYVGQGNWFAAGQHIPAGTYKAPISYNTATLGAAARAGLKGAVRFAPYVGWAYTAMELADWVMDPETGEVHKNDGIPQQELTPGQYTWCFASTALFGHSGRYCSTQLSSVCAYVTGKGYQSGADYRTVVGCAVHWSCYEGTACQVMLDNQGSPGFVGRVQYSTQSGDTNVGASTPHTSVTDDELVNAIHAQGPAAQRAMLHAPDGSPHRFAELVAAENALAAALEAKYGTPQPITRTSNPVVSPLAPPGTANPDLDPVPAKEELELPAFCTWAKVVCDFIEWVKLEPEIEEVVLPVDETAIEVSDWESGAPTSGTCPMPVGVNVWNTSVEFSYQPMCDFLAMLRYVVIAGALCMGAFIIGGVRGTV